MSSQPGPSASEASLDHHHHVVAAAQQQQQQQPAETSKPRLAKHKIAMKIMYCGKNYYGMQVNKGLDTIEARLQVAFARAGVSSPENASDLKKIGFQRCARTDRGVSALGQIVVLKAILVPDFIDAINQQLPPDIRAVDYVRVGKSFCARNRCDARTYDYILPSHIFSRNPIPDLGANDSDLKLPLDPGFRISDAQLGRLNDLLSLYVGTHNFHNYTSGKTPTDASAKRYVMSFKCTRLAYDYGHAHEFLVCRVVGQSFMLHQIRKMIGTVLAVYLGHADESQVPDTFSSKFVSIPRAPGLGLLLNSISFDFYNATAVAKGSNLLVFKDKPADIEFTHRVVYKDIIDAEVASFNMENWVSHLHLHTLKAFDTRDELWEHSKAISALLGNLTNQNDDDEDINNGNESS